MNNNTSYCFSFVGERKTEIEVLLVSAPVSGVSLLLCLLAIILVFILKLYKILVYRLALYQVLGAIGFSTIWIIIAAGNIDYRSFPSIAFEAILMGTTFLKLILTVWISIHLCALAVFHRNLRRLELLYVASSLLVPLLITVGLLVTNAKNHTPTFGNICFRESIIYCVLFVALFLTSLLIITMGTVLCRRAYRGRTAALSEYDKQHKKALYEMLPLLTYPIVFFLLAVPVFVIAVINLNAGNDFDYAASLSALLFAILSPIWSFATSLLLILHIILVNRITKQKRLKRNAANLTSFKLILAGMKHGHCRWIEVTRTFRHLSRISQRLFIHEK